MPEELSFGIEENFVKKWHLMRQKYFSQKPNPETRKAILLNTVIPREEIEEIESIISIMKSKKELSEIIENFYQDFDKILERSLLKG